MKYWILQMNMVNKPIISLNLESSKVINFVVILHRVRAGRD